MPGWEEAWVTVAVDDELSVKALVLARSLRRMMTNRKILVIAGPSVSKSMRKRLEDEFDGFFRFGDGYNGKGNGVGGLSVEAYGKMYCLTLTFIKKLVYVNPNSMVIHNCDQLFEKDGIIIGNIGMYGPTDAILATFSPSLDAFEEWMDNITPTQLQSHNENCFEKWILEQQNGFVDNKFTCSVDVSSGLSLHQEIADLSIVNFVGDHPLELTMKNGMEFLPTTANELEKSLLNSWKSLYCEITPGFPREFCINEGTSARHTNEPIAIIGMSCRLPGSDNIEELWNLLLKKEDAIQVVPNDRWTPEQYPTVTAEERQIQAGFLKGPIDEFDSKFFGMSPFELSYTDPQQRLLLEMVWEGLEDAAINPTSLQESRTGIFTGTWTNDYKDSLIEAGQYRTEFYRSYMGNSYGASAGRIAHFLGTTGSNIATESGCSSSIVAVGLACKSLRRKESNIAIACGVNLLIHPFANKDLNSIVSPDGRCKTFDIDADGFGRAEGCGVLVLKRLSDAVRENDRIHSLIRGYGEAQEGPSSSMGTPTIQCESLAMRFALSDAGIQPHEVSYVEAHGTGTPVGDPMEMEAIAQVYSQGRKTPLCVGSVKSNLGHTESCSGITGIIKTVLSMQKEIIPPHIGCKTLNPRINLDKIPAFIPLDATEWKTTEGQRRYAGVSSFGITGTDAHIILEEAPQNNVGTVKSETLKELPLSIITLSAKSKKSLEDLVESYRHHLQKYDSAFCDVAFTANTGRAHLLPFRAAIVGSSCSEIVNQIEKNSFCQQQVQPERPKLCFAFPGQNSQYHNMGLVLYQTFPVFRQNFDHCEALLRMHGISVREVMWGKELSDQLHQTLYSQTTIFCIEYSLFKLWESWGIKPDMVVAISLGEFAAATAAGILTVEDAIKLVATRSKLIDSLPEGKMLVVKENRETVDKLLKLIDTETNFWLDYAAINSPSQTVLAGRADSIKLLETYCINNNISTKMIDSTHAFHSRDMDPILSEYRKVLESVKFSQPTCEYISGKDGKTLENGTDVEYWIQHTRNSIRFIEASKQVYVSGARICLDVGPQPHLASLFSVNMESIPNHDPVLCVPSMKSGENDLSTILKAVALLYTNGFDLDWDNLHKYHSGRKASLPFYPFQRKKYWFESTTNKSQTAILNAKQLHPLVGYPFSNASSSKIFQTCIDTTKESYLLDHTIGRHVIFPASGFIEMCLSAGYASTLASFEDFTIPPTPVVVEDLKIEASLAIEKDDRCEIQTVVVTNPSDESGKRLITIHKQQGKDSLPNKWIRHATGLFYCTGPTPANSIRGIDIAQLKAESKELNSTEFYDKLATVGLNFGPMFRSLKKAWNISKGEIIAEMFVPSEKEAYLCHPVVIDAMIQALIVCDWSLASENKLFVPICIKNFTWISRSDSEVNYIHVFLNESQLEKTVVLYDESGKRLAVMKGVQIIETTLETITRALESQKVCLPTIYEEVWRPQPHSGEHGVEFQDDFLGQHKLEMVEKLDMYNSIALEECDEFMSRTNKTVCLLLIQSLHELNWNYKLGEEVDIDKFMHTLGIIKSHRLLLRRFIEMLEEDGYLRKCSDYVYMVSKVLPPSHVASDSIKQITASLPPDWLKPQELVLACMEKLTKVLLGKETVLPILFPEGGSKISADVVYRESLSQKKLSDLLDRTITYLIENRIKNLAEGKVFKILEIGAGTGSATSVALPLFRKHNVDFSYTFTDLSTAFFIKAEQRFQEYSNHLRYKILDIEKDPMIQGFSPREYDLVIAANVLHATQDITDAVRNANVLIKPGGLCLVLETFIPQRIIDASFGLLEGYWRFTDYSLRSYHTLIDHRAWSRLMSEVGFQANTTINILNDQSGIVIGEAANSPKCYIRPRATIASKIWLLFGSDTEFRDKLKGNLQLSGRLAHLVKFGTEFRQNSESGHEVRPDSEEDMKAVINWVLETPDSEVEGLVYMTGLEWTQQQQIMSQGYLNLLKACCTTRFSQTPKLIVVTEGTVYLGDQEPVLPTSGTLWGISRSFRTEHPNFHVRCVDVEPEYECHAQVQQVFSEMWNDDQEYQIAYRQNIRHYLRSAIGKFPQIPLLLPNSSRYALILPSSKAITDLRFGVMAKMDLEENDIEVVVKAAGLNFKDVLNVLKPDVQFENSNSVGADFAGIISAVGAGVQNLKVGDAVIGCNFDGGALPSHIRTLESAVVTLPTDLTFAEGATLPAVFATAYHSLVTIGNLKKGETILIHAASGGVGICAIQISQEIGARVIATAGSRKKRAYLRSMGVEHVFHSRTLDFGTDIQRVTEGKGVQMVLNTLTSPGFIETSLASCSRNGRFVELSKLNIWTEDEVKTARPDVQYVIVDLTEVSLGTWENLFIHLGEWLHKNKIQPIPYTRFDTTCIRDALMYLQKAQHVGKVVCVMPDTTLKDGELVIKNNLYNDRSTYLITGGLGGIGLEVAKRMVDQGARNLILCGRSAPNEKALAVISHLNLSGNNVVVLQADIGDVEDCHKILNFIRNPSNAMPPLKGIMHAAGCLSDGLVSNQTWEKYESCFNSKVEGAWNLHSLTKHYRLEHFVLYSSIGAILGAMGQSNHAAANAYMDALAHYRNALGLPGTSINWGQWSEVGVAADLEIPGISPFTPAQAFNALELILKSRKAQAQVVEFDISSIKLYNLWIKSYFSEIKTASGSRTEFKRPEMSSQKFWEEIDSAEDEQKNEVMSIHIVNSLFCILKLDSDDKIDAHQTFQDMGLDSLMMVELKNILQGLLGTRVTLTMGELSDCNSVHHLSNRLVEIIYNKKIVTPEEFKLLISEDSILPDHIKGDGNYPNPEDIKTVLLTGCTGNLGPYILELLSNREQIRKIYCIIRETKAERLVENRLMQNLKKRNILDKVDMKKVECISGNIAMINLGLTEEVYKTLASEVDAVFTCAVKAHHLEEYRKSEGTTDIRSVNVLGTRRVLEFATATRTKWVYQASTLIYVMHTDGDRFPECWPKPTEQIISASGYALSKYVGDILINQAVDRGIPCKILRFPYLAGDSRSGYVPVAENHIFLRYLAYMKMGMMPAVPFPIMLMPVDKAADISLTVFFEHLDQAPFGVYNVTNPHNQAEQDFIKVAEMMGYPIKVVEFDEFVKKLEDDGENSPLYAVKELYTDPKRLNEIVMAATVHHKWLANPEEFLVSKKLMHIVTKLNEIVENPLDTLTRDLQYAKSSELWNKFGL